ncbi:probable GTP-binding protein OBGC2 isoform X2 [Phragmites australis]|uniref:probable GTP-binding protein OBGC2 isoform X2 n=1 Tax=Phragmites australis TaxID=29695 RepID=UPI002D796266|nr:probable GTP-binding protein OBGC2 isoform X2 [Phragmites australis]
MDGHDGFLPAIQRRRCAAAWLIGYLHPPPLQPRRGITMALLLHPRLPAHPLRSTTHRRHAFSDGSCLLPLLGLVRKHTPFAVTCRVARVKEPGPTAGAPPPPQSLKKEAHKYFDHAVVTVRAGDGGHGAVLAMPPAPSADAAKPRGRFNKDKKKSKKVSYKRNYDGSVALPMGGHGGDIVVYADEAEETLLRFHEKARYCAKRGGNVGAAGGTLSSRMHSGFVGETLRIPVPVGTVVKRKKGTVLADLAHPGDEVLVARGGQGGISLIDVPEYRRRKAMALSPNIMRDASDKGLPNAGKSTLLSVITLARPDIADYPFTTLMPNLGRLGGDPALGALQFSSEATLADLPGLIEGAHLGKGLGRNFLRHLRRTRVIVHVIDAAADDPVNDYKIVREELRMYNPQYLERPYVVVLNKIDLPKAHDRLSSLAFEISSIGCEECHDRNASKNNLNGNISEHQGSSEAEIEGDEKELGDYPRPQAVVAASVLRHIGIDEMLKEIRAALRKCFDHKLPEP